MTIQKVRENDMLDTSIKDCSSYIDYNPPHAEIKSEKVRFSIDTDFYLKNRKLVGTCRRFPSDGSLITLPLKMRDEEPPPSRL